MSAPHRLDFPPLYAILDTEQTKGRSPDVVLRTLLNSDVKVLQLLAKVMSPREFLQLARETRALTQSYGCRFIVNDRVDIALASNAAGVLLGQEDLPLHPARKWMGKKIIEISTQNLEQPRKEKNCAA